ncbi:unnamed protein product [Blepharisma stoltei]|uniref:Transmembrane protein n=1 Tax=Blepharisma stoltei TaxID=1481888 RepID=A0AAU9JIE5_9CILI|nr:unnamed protein product [Blepharisma stoltei]
MAEENTDVNLYFTSSTPEDNSDLNFVCPTFLEKLYQHPSQRDMKVLLFISLLMIPWLASILIILFMENDDKSIKVRLWLEVFAVSSIIYLILYIAIMIFLSKISNKPMNLLNGSFLALSFCWNVIGTVWICLDNECITIFNLSCRVASGIILIFHIAYLFIIIYGFKLMTSQSN